MGEQQKIVFSSKEMDWETPQDLFNELNAIFHFDVDVCAEQRNAKMAPFIGPEQDALACRWDVKGKDTVAFMNPPYGRKSKDKPWTFDFIMRAFEQVDKGWIKSAHVLIAARTETSWFDVIWRYASSILFFAKRIQFIKPGKGGNATFPSVLASFGPEPDEFQIDYLCQHGNLILPEQGGFYLWSRDEAGFEDDDA